MLRQSAKEQVSLMRPCQNQKSQQAQSRGYKSRQARKWISRWQTDAIKD
jgi:hypothetical protein